MYIELEHKLTNKRRLIKYKLASQPYLNSPVRVKKVTKCKYQKFANQVLLFYSLTFRDSQEQELFGINDVTLIKISTKDLNKLIREKNISKQRSDEIKRERRRLKNRGYAANCRINRDAAEDRLSKENEAILKRLDNRRKYRREVESETEEKKLENMRISDEIARLAEEERKLEESCKKLKAENH